MIPLIVSVPHNATRTLVQHLGFEHGHAGPEFPLWCHFKQNAELLDANKVHAHIPVRDPVAVAESWARRGKDIDDLVENYRRMFTWIAERPYTLWDMAAVPRLAGTDDHQVDRDPELKHLVDCFKTGVSRTVVAPHAAFFNQFGYDT